MGNIRLPKPLQRPRQLFHLFNRVVKLWRDAHGGGAIDVEGDGEDVVLLEQNVGDFLPRFFLDAEGGDGA